MLTEYPLVTSLETKIENLCRDRAIARRVIDGNNSIFTLDTALENYIELREDSTIPVGIRYLALSCIATHHQLYPEDRDLSKLKDIISRELDIPTHTEIFNAIRVVKNRYYQIYECNPREFDRIERLVQEMSHPSTSESDNFQDEFKTQFTILQSEKKRAEQQAKLFKIIAVIFGTISVAGISGLGVALFMSQQQSISVANKPQENIPVINTPQPTSVPIIVPSPSITSTPEPQATATPSSNTILEPIAIATPDPQVSQDEAIDLIQRWLETKKTLFAPPFDRELGASLTTGKAYQDAVRGPSSDGTPDSSSQWLEKYGYYYSYGLQRIERVDKFEVNGNNAVIDVTMTEDVTLYNSKGELQKNRSSLEQKTIRYVLIKENDTLKISDYNNLTSSKRVKG
jgi:hypothetical protein